MVEGDAPRSHTCAHNLLIVPPELYLSREVVCKRVAKLLHMVGVETTFTRKVVGKMLFFMIAEVCFCVCVAWWRRQVKLAGLVRPACL